MNKKKIIIGILTITCICVGSITFYLSKSTTKQLQANQNKIESIETTSKGGAHAKIFLFKDLTEIKSESDLIVEVEGTDKQEKRDYKGAPSIVTTLKVKEVFKGDKSLKEVKIIQIESINTVPENGQRLVMFLRRGVDNLDCYGVVGGGQGIYKIENKGATLKPQAIENKNIIKELSGNYEDVKDKLK
jgi:hypothetical protein